MGVSNSLGIFQEKMDDLLQGLKFIRAYTDGLLILTKGHWGDNLTKLELNLTKLKEIGLKCNIKKYFYGQTEI